MKRIYAFAIGLAMLVAPLWTIGGESAVLGEKGGGIAYRFHARDLHLVLGPGPGGAPVHFRVTIGGKAPGDGHGADTDAEGLGVVSEQPLYQLVERPAKSAITRSRSNSSILACRRSDCPWPRSCPSGCATPGCGPASRPPP